MRRPALQLGFTLLELMLTLTIAGIVAGIGVPAMRTMMLNNRLTGVGNDLLASLQHAREEALKFQTNVVVCGSPDSTAAVPTCGNGNGGWIVFQDLNGNYQVDANETILERHQALDATIFVRADGQAVQFNPSGFATPPGVVVPLRNIVFCDSRGVVQSGAKSTARGVVVSTTGRARVVSSVADVNAALAVIGGTCP